MSVSKRKRKRPPADPIRARIRRGAALFNAGFSLAAAARRLNLPEDTLRRYQERHPELWAAVLEGVTPAESPDSSMEASGPTADTSHPGMEDRTYASIVRGAALVASGLTFEAASEKLGIRPGGLSQYRHVHRERWDAEFAVAIAKQLKADAEIRPPDKRPPSAEVRAGIRQATALLAAGLREREVINTMGVRKHTVEEWRKKHREVWTLEYDRAMEVAAAILAKQTGITRVVENPAAFVRQARRCRRWRKANKETPPELSPAMSLSQFFWAYYEPMRLRDASPQTVAAYRSSLRYWETLTGSPALQDITAQTLHRFLECLRKMPGAKPGSLMSINRIRTHLRQVGLVLAKAGPPEARNRDAAALIDRVPWIKSPREEVKQPRAVPAEHLAAVYQAADRATFPVVAGVKPADWWRALIVVAYNTGLRHRSLLAMRFADVDWKVSRLTLPPAATKPGRELAVHLNATAVEHLAAIRGERELVFEFPHSERTYYREFHRLQDAAGIPAEDHFGLHAIRRTLASVLWTTSPQAAKLGLDHMQIGTTAKHYIESGPIVAAALDRLPQPFKNGGKTAA